MFHFWKEFVLKMTQKTKREKNENQIEIGCLQENTSLEREDEIDFLRLSICAYIVCISLLSLAMFCSAFFAYGTLSKVLFCVYVTFYCVQLFWFENIGQGEIDEMPETDKYIMRPKTLLITIVSIIAFLLIICSAHLIDAKEVTYRSGRIMGSYVMLLAFFCIMIFYIIEPNENNIENVDEMKPKIRKNENRFEVQEENTSLKSDLYSLLTSRSLVWNTLISLVTFCSVFHPSYPVFYLVFFVSFIHLMYTYYTNFKVETDVGYLPKRRRILFAALCTLDIGLVLSSTHLSKMHPSPGDPEEAKNICVIILMAYMLLFVFYAKARSYFFSGNEISRDRTSAAHSKDEPIHRHMYCTPMQDLEYIIELKVNQILDDREQLRNGNMKRKMSL